MKIIFCKDFSNMEDAYNFQLSLQGEKIHNSANAMQVGGNIIAMAQILQEVAETLLTEEQKEKFSIEIKGFEKGSFVTEFQLLLGVLPTLPLGITTAKDIFDVTKNYFEFRKFLQGEDPQKVEVLPNNKVEVTNQQGDKSIIHQQVYNITHNYNINGNVEKIFANPQDAEKISIKEPRDGSFIETFSVDEEESEYFENPWTEEDEKEAEISIERMTVTILVASLEARYSSRFKVLGKTFYAKILDEEYWKNPPRVTRGDKLDVDMEVSISTNNKQRFRILKVFQHIPAPEQLSINNI